MATTITPDILVSIQLADSKGDVYVPGAGVTGAIKSIILHNTDSAVQEVKLFFDDGSNSYQFANPLIAPKDTVVIPLGGEGMAIVNGKKIEGNTDTAAKVTCMLCGSKIEVS